MPRFLLVLLLLSCSYLGALQTDFDARSISTELATLIESDKPLFIEVRAGEYSHSLQKELISVLLSQGADIRESKNNLLYDVEQSTEETDVLSFYGLGSATLVQINMDINWESQEDKRLFSYQSTRIPVYSFDLRFMDLPGYRVRDIKSYTHLPKHTTNKSSESSRMRWFDPIIATAALGSLIYLLWNTE